MVFLHVLMGVDLARVFKLLKHSDEGVISVPVEPTSGLQSGVGQPDVLGVDWDDGSPREMSNFGKSGPENSERGLNNVMKEDVHMYLFDHMTSQLWSKRPSLAPPGETPTSSPSVRSAASLALL